jgi:predicted O-methyltransferase YrrM
MTLWPTVAASLAAFAGVMLASVAGSLLMPSGTSSLALPIAVATGIIIAFLHRWKYWDARLQSELRSQLLEARALAALGPVAEGHLPHRNWSLAPDALLEVLNVVHPRPAAVVVEVGSGVSTVLIAATLQRAGGGHVYALEHDARWAGYVRRLVAERQLTEYVTVVEAPLTPRTAGDRQLPWFDEASIREVTSLTGVDVLVIDGPPSRPGELSRYPALPLLRHILADDAVVFLDDSRRPGETETVRLWCHEFGLTATEHQTARGLTMLRRDPKRAGTGTRE